MRSKLTDRSFVGRKKEIEQLRRSYAARLHVLIVGPAGIGKTALFREMRHYFPFLLCEETSSLRRICESLERQLGWAHRNMNVFERKNRLLPYLARRGEVIVLDSVALTPPRVARFIAGLVEHVPVWIACRSTQRKEIGAVWEHLYRFERVELAPLSLSETGALLRYATSTGGLPALSRNHILHLHRRGKGNPRVLEELLMELASREYELENPFARKLLDLDRRIHTVTATAHARSG